MVEPLVVKTPLDDLEVFQHEVRFLAPGTMFAEQVDEDVEEWDIDAAVERAGEIRVRHGARPHSFYFFTMGRKVGDLDSHETQRSCLYYLGGTVRTQEEVLAGTDPKEDILRSNVSCNDMKRLIQNDNSWRFTAELKETDVVLDVTLPELPEETKTMGSHT